MKCNLFPALLALASVFVSPFLSTAQTPIASDSLFVFWEQLDGPPGYVFKYAEGGGRLFAAAPEALYVSSNEGQNWRYNRAWGRRKVLGIFASDAVVLALQANMLGHAQNNNLQSISVWRSTNGGGSWEEVFNAPIGVASGSDPGYQISDFATDGGTAISFLFSRKNYFDTFSKRFYSTDNGLTWATEHSAPTFRELRTLTFADGLYSGLWRKHATTDPLKGYVCSSVSFADFQSIPLPTLGSDLRKAVHCAGAFHLFLADNTLMSSTDQGATWTSQAFPPDSLREVIVYGNTFFLRTASGVWRGDFSAPTDLTKVYAGEHAYSAAARVFCATPSGYWANTFTTRSIFSKNGIEPWEIRSQGMLSGTEKMGAVCGKLLVRNSNPDFGAGDPSVYNSSNAQDGEWAQNVDTANWYLGSLPVGLADNSGGGLLGDWNGYSYCYSGAKFFRSPNCGESWDTIPHVFFAAITGMKPVGNRVYFYSKSDFNLLFTDDNGESWLTLATPSDGIWRMHVMGDTLMVFGTGNALYRSPDAGLTWDTIAPLPMGDVFQNGSELIGIGGHSLNFPNSSLAVSLDKGSTWTQTFSTDHPYASAFNRSVPASFPYFSNGLIFMHANNGLYVSSDAGLHWSRFLNLPFRKRISFFDSDYDPLFDATPEGASYYFADDGYLYAATEAQGIWRTELAPVRDHALVKGGKYGILSGRLYRDTDASCEYNTANGDVPLGHKPLTLQPGNIAAVTDANGKYSVALPPGNYTLSTIAPAYHTASCGAAQPYAVTTSATTSADLIFQPEPDIKDLCVLFTTPVRARPGFPVSYKVQVNNVGTASVSGAVLTVDFDEQWLESGSISPIGQFLGNQAVVPLPDLAPGQAIIITLHFIVSVNTPLGTDLFFAALCQVNGDAKPANNRAVATQTVTGSFDPNDKTAQPVEAQLPFQPRTFDYLIRFQNTGTDTAFTVVVTDTLDPRFNLMSLRTLESSHAFEFRMLENRVVKWIFRDILLADSNTNEVASHGYIRFQIETKPDALPGSAIPNDADIFFDFNSPVRTNESLAENPKWSVLNATSVELCEGDTWNGSIWEESTLIVDTVSTAWTDTVWVTDVAVWPVWETQHDITVSSGSLVFGRLVTQDTAFAFQYQTIEGCDSTIVWNVEVLTTGTEDLPGRNLRFEISPNPAAQETWLSARGSYFGEKRMLKIRLRDAAGRLWQEWDGVEMSAQEGFRLEIEDLPGGFYFVEIQTEGLRTTKRLVKI